MALLSTKSYVSRTFFAWRSLLRITFSASSSCWSSATFFSCFLIWSSTVSTGDLRRPSFPPGARSGYGRRLRAWFSLLFSDHGSFSF